LAYVFFEELGGVGGEVHGFSFPSNLMTL
jgi:hypothetical protein